MTFLNHLEFGQVSVINQPIFIKMADWYYPPVNDELLEIAQTLDLVNVRSDYLVLLGQIKDILVANNLLGNQPLVTAINQSLADGEYYKAPEYIEKAINLESPDINPALIPQLSQLCNICLTFNSLNKMPGLDGKNVDLLKIPELV